MVEVDELRIDLGPRFIGSPTVLAATVETRFGKCSGVLMLELACGSSMPVAVRHKYERVCSAMAESGGRR